MGAQSTAALTETRDNPAPAATRAYVGIDAGRRQHVVVVISRERMENGSWDRVGARHIPTSSRGFRELSEWLGSLGLAPAQIAIGCEPTGGWYSRTVAAWLERHGYVVSWLQNVELHDRRRLLIGKQTKTDALDARLIARLLYERDSFGLRRGFLHRPPRSTDALRLLVRSRHQMIKQRSRHRLQLNAVVDVLFPEFKDFFSTSITGRAARRLLEEFPTPHHIFKANADALRRALIEASAQRKLAMLSDLQRAAHDSAGLVEGIEPIVLAESWLLRQLRLVDQQIDEVEQALANALASWPARDRAVMASLPLMTIIRQAVLLSAIGEIASFQNDRQLRKYLGWYPELKESGTSVSQHTLGLSGNRLARREFWLWSMQLLTPLTPATPFRAYYQRLRDRGMPGSTALGHLAGKLVSVLFYCLRRGELYDPERHRRDLGLGDV